MTIKRITLVLALALVCAGAQAQSRKTHKPSKTRTSRVVKGKVSDDMKGSGASVYDLDADLPEDASMGSKGATVSVDTVRQTVVTETLIPTAEIDDKNVLQAEASSPLDRVEVCDASGKVLRSTGLHKSTKASVDLNQFPKDQTLVFKFYGVNGNTQNIELSH